MCLKKVCVNLIIFLKLSKMRETEILDKVIQIFEQNLGLRLKQDDLFIENGIDQTVKEEVFLFLELEFLILFPMLGKDIKKMKNISDIVDFIMKKQG